MLVYMSVFDDVGLYECACCWSNMSVFDAVGLYECACCWSI